MIRLRFRRRAKDELDRALHDMAQVNLAYALKWLDELENLLELLLEFPEMGHSIEQYGVGLRRIGHRRYWIYYRVSPGRVDVLRVLPQHQNALPT